MYAEDCYCPNGDTVEWKKTVGCPGNYSQIERDLSYFQEVDFDKVLKEAAVRFNQAGSRSFCNYVVKDNKVSSWQHLFLHFRKLNAQFLSVSFRSYKSVLNKASCIYYVGRLILSSLTLLYLKTGLPKVLWPACGLQYVHG